MLRNILTFSIGICVTLNIAQCQTRDTSKFLFKTKDNGSFRVNSLDSADFIRLVLPPDPGDTLVNIKEYYMNGKLKFLGKSDRFQLPAALRFILKKDDIYDTGIVLLSGTCITFYPNGKKKLITIYNHNIIHGLEYSYYPDGKIYSVKKYVSDDFGIHPVIYHLDCYDATGKQICKEGEGYWLFYDDSNQIQLEGPVKKGLPNGEWHGATLKKDSIKYTYQFKNGNIISKTGYDKKGKAYPFNEVREGPSYTKDNVGEADIIRNCVKLPESIAGKKISREDVTISFILEKDGTLTHPEISGISDTSLTVASKNALLKLKKWKPAKYYGIPVRVRLSMPLKDHNQDKGTFTVRVTKQTLEIIED